MDVDNLPDEVLSYILSFLDEVDLQNCRLVCYKWKELLEGNVWRYKLDRGLYKMIRTTAGARWEYYHRLCEKKTFGRNLLLNNCGQMGIACWKGNNPLVDSSLPLHIIDFLIGSPNAHIEGWSVEDSPIGSQPLPLSDDFGGFTSCFATTYFKCCKSQYVDLRNEGVHQYVMDNLQPEIEVSEWYAGRSDAGSMYQLSVCLVSEEKRTVTSFEHSAVMTTEENGKWTKVRHKFVNYGPGVRYVQFMHLGKDTTSWAGNYGAKMSGGVVKLLLPSLAGCSTQNNEGK